MTGATVIMLSNNYDNVKVSNGVHHIVYPHPDDAQSTILDYDKSILEQNNNDFLDYEWD